MDHFEIKIRDKAYLTKPCIEEEKFFSEEQ